jgi:hypothetical protein
MSDVNTVAPAPKAKLAPKAAKASPAPKGKAKATPKGKGKARAGARVNKVPTKRGRKPLSASANLKARIVVLPKGKENPRNKGTGPFERYAVILKSKTVGDFLAKLPDWYATLLRAQKEGYIKIAA